MTALNTDKFKKLARKWVAQIGSGGVADNTATTIPLSSTANLPTDTAILITIDRVDVNGKATPNLEEGVVGIVSGSNLINCIRGVEGTAQAHSAGAVVEVLFTAKGWNDEIDAILVGHNQDGTHNSEVVTTLKATGSEVDTGTSDAKIVTPKAIADSGIAKAKATGSEVDTGTNDVKFVTPKAIADSKLMFFTASRFYVGSFTRDASAASGDVSYTGVGFQPKAIIFLSAVVGTAKASWGFTYGSSDYNNQGIFQVANGNMAVPGYKWIVGAVDTFGTTEQFATLKSFDSNGFTLSWNKDGSPTGTIEVRYLAIR